MYHPSCLTCLTNCCGERCFLVLGVRFLDSANFADFGDRFFGVEGSFFESLVFLGGFLASSWSPLAGFWCPLLGGFSRSPTAGFLTELTCLHASRFGRECFAEVRTKEKVLT